MQKVVYSVSKVNHRDEKMKGIGFLAEGNLMIPAISKSGKPYIKVFEGVLDRCKLISDTSNEFKGYITVAYTDVPVYREKTDNHDIVDYIEIEYSVWFKYVD